MRGTIRVQSGVAENGRGSVMPGRGSRRGWSRALIAAALLVLFALSGSSASADNPVNHGITFTKGCASPTGIGQPYSCTYSIRNIVDEAQDTLTIHGLVDTVHSAGGDVSSGNVFSSLQLTIGALLPGFSTLPTCPGATGTGTALDPFRAPGLTSCTLPFGSRLNAQSFSFYTVQAGDFNLPGHQLADSAALSWNDLCDDPIHTGNTNCNPNPPAVGAASQAVVLQGGGSGGGGGVNHGITFTKGCASPTQIGQPYSCTYSIRNIVDEAQDTLTIHGLVDTVHSAGGDVSSGNVFSSLQLTIGALLPGFSTLPTCPGATGTGTALDPFRAPGLTSCTLPFGSRLNVQFFSFYTVQAGDFNLPGHQLADSAALSWNDLCDDPIHTGNTNCNPNPPAVGAASQSLVTQLPSTTSTTIHNAAHAPVTAVPVGSVVHDFVTVNGGPGNPLPTGSVTIDWFLNGTCAGAPAVNSGSIGPLNGGQFDAVGFAFTNNSAGSRAFRAHYEGDATYISSDGACEPLAVVDANIQITPVTDANTVGTNHVLTITVNALGGTIDAGPQTATASIVSGPGSFVSSPSCTYTGGAATATCTVTITSSVTGRRWFRPRRISRSPARRSPAQPTRPSTRPPAVAATRASSG